MKTFDINCSQRGCVSTVDGEAAPKKCPVCNHPLLKGDAVEHGDAPAPAPSPSPIPAPAPSSGDSRQ